ncbi:hypothetical protein N799_08645 [Lysobacter arseniciresistens ZS79]|uniref:Uncharacterized protein n=2 Tax=Novilysobacter TaxID=3382699 RepID=A0A0A0EW82_9GAMM|nr:hypothetical protein N799_08645 [Lysobacter arseniciresistens ZS79]
MRSVQAYSVAHTLAEAIKSSNRKLIDLTIRREIQANKNDVVKAALKQVGKMADQERVGKIVNRLIEAVQTANPEQLREAIAWQAKLIDKEQDELAARLDTAIASRRGEEREEACSLLGRSRKTYVDDGLVSCMGITALHVACGNYVLHKEHRAQFNEMIRDLLEAGANPCRAAGRKVANRAGHWVEVDPGKTVSEICRGNMPPALTDYFSSQVAEPVVNHRSENQMVDKRSERIKEAYANSMKDYESSMEELDEYFGVAA